MNQVARSPALPAVTWARARLRLGQANVGFWVLLAVVTLAWRPALATGPATAQALAWAGLVLVFVALQLPFDVVGGWVLPTRHGRFAGSFRAWLAGWARGVAAHAGVVGATGVAVMITARTFGSGAAFAVTAAATLALAAAQGWLFTVSTGRALRPPDPSLGPALAAAGLTAREVRVAEADDRSFRGDWVGLPGAERLVVPRGWLADPDLRDVQLLRRALARDSGARARGLLGAAAFDLSGWALVLALVPGAGVQSASGLLLASAGFTLWAFLGLLTLPSLSRRAVHAVDRGAAARLGVARVARTLRRLDADQEDEDDADRPAWVAAIFHPVPTPSQRVAQLAEPDGGAPPYRITRTALFLSWAQLSWLSRAVHCNIGRSDLWVMLPGD